MNEDLISRSALKEEFAKHEDRKGYLIGDWEDIIDNAPTVERPQGDLISRMWLKEHKFTTQVCNGLEIEDVDVVAVATIDNAPPVDIKPFALFSFDKEELEQIVRDRVIEPIKNGELVVKTEERPQGKYDDFLIASGPRRSGKTTALIKEVCKINRENGRNVAVIICWSHAEAHHIASQADELGYTDMPYPITVEEIRRGSGHGRGSFYKYAFVNDLDRIAKALISPLCLQLRGFSYTLPIKEAENDIVR